jgi:hypothetical protein
MEWRTCESRLLLSKQIGCLLCKSESQLGFVIFGANKEIWLFKVQDNQTISASFKRKFRLIPQNKKLKQQGDQSNFLLEVY